MLQTLPIMKYLFTLLFAILFVAQQMNGQNQRKCAELMISEIVYSGDSSQNFAVEIFNPTDFSIDLSNYKIELLPEQGGGTSIPLSGSILSHDVVVITTRTAITEIDTIADIKDNSLIFDDKSVLQLVKGTSTVIDKVGNQGLGTTVGQIDLEQLLTDPTYLQNMNIDLSSIKNIVIRRLKWVQAGKPDFANVDILNDWAIYPDLEISGLGEHINACVVPAIRWKGYKQFEPEADRWEWDDSNIVVGTIEATEPLTEDVDIFILSPAAHEFTIPPNLPFATEIDDFLQLQVNQVLTLTATIPPSSEYEVELMRTVDDFIGEGDEGTGFILTLSSTSEPATLDEEKALYDVLIMDDDFGNTTAKIISSQIKVYPVVVDDFTILETSTSELKIEEVAIFNLENKLYKWFELGKTTYAKLDLASINEKGFYLLVIKTDKGITIKKIVKG